ncbi:mitochondrial import inner membrane translocase subunit TIM50 isoform X4 [Gossypium raimondii]|uniref:mitochondrial import inner membrane translocase subunit TIM50 isoform X4 n=1 Tax=Gossypium raimondii TaxID=29730 RepID=UPI00227CF030|nr:mitochondrial import inner membrane translocase subunit TIM50 isoform X4 [Gossypium raimondii]
MSCSDPSKGTIFSSQSILSDQSTPPPPAPKVAPQVLGGKIWSFVKYGLIAGVTGTTGYAGYLSYKIWRLALLRCNDRRLVEEHLLEYNEPTSDKHLPDLHPLEQHVFTLVLDLNETLLYTDWKRERGWRTFKRPGVDAFLEHLAKFYEIVVYSDQMNMYVDSVCEMLDTDHCIRSRLSRGATKYPNGKHYGDLSKLNRDPTKILYVSAHAFDSSLKPENCVPIKPFKLETDDTALLDLIPFLEYVARNSPADIRQVLQSYERKDIAKEFLEHSKEYQRRVQEQKQQGRLWQR